MLRGSPRRSASQLALDTSTMACRFCFCFSRNYRDDAQRALRAVLGVNEMLDAQSLPQSKNAKPGWVHSRPAQSEVALRERSCSGIDAEQLCCGSAEDRDAVVVAQARDRHDVVDRDAVPRERVVGADDDLADAGLGDQVAHPLRGEHDRVEIELTVLQV